MNHALASEQPAREVSSLRVLIVEDDPADAELALIELETAGMRPSSDIVQTAEDFADRLHSGSYDIVLSDYALAGWTGMDALDILRRRNTEIPFILVTGMLGEENAVECIIRGATDFVLKSNLARLPHVVLRAMEESAVRKQRIRAEQALRASEERYRTIVETALEGICVIDENDRVSFVNTELASMLHLTVDEIVGKSAHESFALESRAVVENCLEQHRRGLTVRSDFSLTLKDGALLWVILRATPLVDEKGCYRGAIAMFTDIAERKQNEAALLQYKQDLQDLTGELLSVQEAERRRLAVDLHDDLSQELAGLALEIGVLAQRPPDSQAELCGRLRGLGENIQDLAKRVHDVARQLHPAMLHDLGLCAALQSECLAFSEHHGIRVEFSADSEPPALSGGLSLCFYRVAQEALRNAGRHSRAKGICVFLRRSVNELVLSIADDGKGFDVAAARQNGGLGLVGMQERARLVNGTLQIRSRPGRGTVVEVRAPLGTRAATG